MAISGGPDIVEDGLVLHLDAAEPLCFRGEPTTNLMPYSNGIASRVAWPYGSYTHSVETTGEFAGWEKIIANTTGTISDYVMRLGDVLCTANTQYTATIEFYAPYGTVEFVIGGNQGGGSIRIGDTNKYYLTFTKNGTTGYMGWYIKTTSSTPANTAIPNGVIYYRRAQMEQKPYYTDFTIGTRGSTVATGGGLLDLTNNGNNGTINRTSVPSAAFYSGNNSGSFVFDGTNDYVDCGYLNSDLSNITDVTFMCYVKIDELNNTLYIIAGRYEGDNGWLISIESIEGEHKFRWAGRESGALFISSNSTFTPNTNTWYFLCGTKRGSIWSLYINGELNNSTNAGNGTTVFLNKPLSIGRQFSQYYWKGQIANSLVYNRALSAKEVQQNYNATKGRYGL